MPKRKSLLSDVQREQFFALPASGKELIHYYTLHDDDLALINQRRRPQNRLGFAVQLCLMRYPGRGLGVGEMPPAPLVGYIADQLGLTIDWMQDYAQRDETRREHLAELQLLLGCRAVTRADYRPLALSILPLALQTDKVDALIPALLEGFRERQILIPSPPVVERIVLISLWRAETTIHRALTRDLTDEQRLRLDQLLSLKPGTRMSYLAWLRLPPNAPVVGNLIKGIERLEFLRDIDIKPEWADRIHRNRLIQLSREGERLTQQHFLRLESERRHAMLTAVVLELMVQQTDDTLDMFAKIMGAMFAKARLRKAEQFHAGGQALINTLGLLARALRAALDARQAATDPFIAMEKVIPIDALMATVDEAEKVAKTEDLECIGLLGDYHHVVRGFAPRMLDVFEFHAAPPAADVLRGLDRLRAMYRTGQRQLDPDMPVSFVKNAWKRYVFLDGGGVDRRYYELCLFAQLRERLRAGEMSVAGSRQYKEFDEYLLSRARYAELRATGKLPVRVPVKFHDYIAQRKERLEARLAEVSAQLAGGTCTDVRLKDGLVSITPLKRLDPPEAENVRRLVSDTLPRIKITDLVMEVDAWTGFANEFVDMRTGDAPGDKPLLYSGLLADGLNLGLTRMADACPGISVSRLYWMSQWHIREDTYARALAQIIDFHHRLPFSRHFGDGTTSSSDGQYFRAGGQGEAHGAVNAHYGDDAGVKFYTHISNQGGPYHVKVISVTESEALHVLDGLRHHESELQIKEHYTDTGGVTEHVFALLHLLGYRFVPRIRNLKDRSLFTFQKASAYPVLERQIGGQINTSHLEAHWDDVLRLISSIEMGTVAASQIMRKLASYPRQNGLSIALREIGRLERTLFTLDWIEDPALRRRSLTMLNLGESCNALKRAVFIHRLGELRDRTLENQRYRANGLNLVVAAIICWNTVYIGERYKIDVPS